ncbi:nitroreductase [Plastoroseomonas hellenica]|uniref:nitroreductase n=1 Tax=Plastoroseomonas hellenica TaxID=2687306 RepID=UPI00346309AE
MIPSDDWRGDSPGGLNRPGQYLSAAEAITSRRSIRAFLPTPVPRETVARLLAIASRAPSGSNTQPWRVHALAGAAREALCADLMAAHEAGTPEEREYAYYPDPWFEPYLARRRKVGWGLYATLGIERGDTVRMKAQQGRNFIFFGAPVGLIVTMDRRLNTGSWIDLGMFLQNIMVAARGEGLDTCPQAALATRHGTVRRHLPIPAEEVVVCGMALGHADPAAPENALETERAPVEAFAGFYGF